MTQVVNRRVADDIRQKHAIMIAYLIMAVGIAYTVPSIPLFTYFHRSWWLIAAHALDCAIIFGLFLFLRLTRRVNAVMWVICAIDIIAIVPLVLDSGIGNTGLLTVTGALLVIFLLKGRAGLKFWTVFAYVPFVLALPLHLIAALPLPYTTPQYGYFLLMEFLAIVLLWLYGGEKEKLDKQLAERTHQLEVAKASVEQKVRERTHELVESEAKLNSTIQSLNTIGLIMVDQQYQTLIKNTAIDKVLKYSDEAWTLQDLAKDVHDVAFLQECARVFNHQQAVVLDDVKFKDGLFLRLGLNPVFSEGKVIGLVLSAQDITEQKILDRSKDEFFSIASHELRTPLTAIRGNMSMLKDYFPGAMKDQSVAAMVDDTHAASVRLIEIVSDFLDSGELEQGKMVFNLEALAIQPVVEAVLSDLGPILKARSNTVQLKGLDGAPKVMVDKGRFSQIMYNLLSNATKYSEHGTITVTVDHDDKYVRLHITDTGKGISPENQQLLFHKFQQAGASILTRDDTKGTGLGLYISKLLATHMHGDVVMEMTEENKGSTFGVILPRAK